MNITVVGAGPAGLYLALLLKKADATHDVTVYERNAPDATFGFGVVFSEETLGSLRDADEPTYLEITDTFARWDAIDITVHGQTLRSRGHGFSAIRRTRLLAILQQRCRQLDVELRFGEEIGDVAALSTEADLVVAADGVNSAIRRARIDLFATEIVPQGCKYVWFGTDLVFDAFRFIFVDNEHGMFQVHGYPFDEHMSTFIVECPGPVWHSAGLGEMSEAESVAFCEKLFAAELDGHRLASNRSQWFDFQRVQNGNWHDGNVVLVGDAAHTAHFTIGSGTKLAMEDSIALAASITRHCGRGKVDDRTAIEAALVDYELERQPVVERFQRAADESAGYFARVGRHANMAPRQFAFNLLTRSGRIGHANLAQRDADFVRDVDSALIDGAAAGRRIAPTPAFTAVRLGGVEVPNRIVRIARTIDELADLAGEGAGMVLTSPVAISLDGRVSPASPTLHNDTCIDDWASAVTRLHETGTAAGILLGHAGRRGATRRPTRGVDVPLPADQAWPLIAASALPYGPFSAVPRQMDADDMARVRDGFAAAGLRAAAAGFDVLGVDCSHGGLLAGFLSPLTNRRSDGFGGDADARLRCPLDVLHAVRDAWPADRALYVRLAVVDWAPGGLTADHGVQVAASLASAGALAVHVEAGQNVAVARPEYGRGYLTTLSDRVRSEAGVRTIVGGRLTTIDEIDTVVAAGRADLCVLDLPAADRASDGVGSTR